MRKFESGLLQYLYDKHIANDPEMVQFYEGEYQRVVIGSEIYELRNKIGLTQSELARRVGTTKEVIDEIEYADYEDNRQEIIGRLFAALNQPKSQTAKVKEFSRPTKQAFQPRSMV